MGQLLPKELQDPTWQSWRGKQCLPAGCELRLSGGFISNTEPVSLQLLGEYLLNIEQESLQCWVAISPTLSVYLSSIGLAVQTLQVRGSATFSSLLQVEICAPKVLVQPPAMLCPHIHIEHLL